ncbi:hypothetical protein [Aurantivibrio infirmus]
MKHTFKIILFCLMGMFLASGVAHANDKENQDTRAEVSQNIPADNVLSKVKVGMNSAEVIEILGPPDLKTKYQTGKRHIPFAGRFLNDARRESWFYEKTGHIVLSKNKYSGVYSVIEIGYNPEQTLP